MKGSSNASISSPTKLRKDALIHVSSNGSVASQQRLYVAPQSTVRAPPEYETSKTTTTSTIDTKARRRRTTTTNINMGGGGGGVGGQLHNSFDAMVPTSYSPQSSTSERSTPRFMGSSIKAKKNKKGGIFLNSSFHHNSNTNHNNSNHHYHDSDNHSSSDDDDSILGNVNTPCLWMDDIEGNVIPTTHNLQGESRNRKAKNLASISMRSKTRNFTTKNSSNKHSSNSSVQSESKYNRPSHIDNNDDDQQSVHTYHTIHSLQHELIVDMGGATATTPYLERKASIGKKMYGLGRQQQQQQRLLLKSNAAAGRNKGISVDERSWIIRCAVPMVQGMVFLLFLYVVFDSRQRSKQHRQQLLILDEERAHILEQMTWIDSAAKKVHKKYSTMVTTASALYPQSEEDNGKDRIDAQHYKEEYIRLQAEMETIQLRVQQNARTRTSVQFGDEPVQVSLPISEGEVVDEHFVIALSDDAPHAVNTFLQQVTLGLWNEIDFQQLQKGRIIQASTRFSDTKPVLEFVEKSRGCHQAGSVALHQLESDDFHVMVLKIHMDAAATVDVDDVCIGNVVKGYDQLQRILSQLPAIELGNMLDKMIE